MARAIERGTGRASRRDGDLRDQGLDVADARARVRKAVDDELSQGAFPGRGDPAGQLVLSTTLAAVSAMALLVIAWQAEWIDLAENGTRFLTYAYGASVVPLWFLLRVSVEVQASSVAQRALRWLGLGVAGALLSGLIGAALKAVGVG